MTREAEYRKRLLDAVVGPPIVPVTLADVIDCPECGHGMWNCACGGEGEFDVDEWAASGGAPGEESK
jgi:hypothetical protein